MAMSKRRKKQLNREKSVESNKDNKKKGKLYGTKKPMSRKKKKR